MKIARYYQKTLFGVFALLGIIVVSTSALHVRSVDKQLTTENLNNARVLARSIANASVDVIVNRDFSQLQTVIDQFLDIKGIAYVFVANEKGQIIAHTFVPGVPREILQDYKGDARTYQRSIRGSGEYIEVTSPVLAGECGRVHVGMDKGYIALQVQTAIGEQVYLFTLLFVASILVSYALMRAVSRPLHSLIQQAGSLAGSTEGSSASLPAEELQKLLERTDEVGEISRLLESMKSGPKPSDDHGVTAPAKPS